MKKLGLLIFSGLLAACSHVVEPLDVVVSQQNNRLELGNNISSYDVTEPKIIKLNKNYCNVDI